MDGPQLSRDEVEARIAAIKRDMPETYRAIHTKAKELGREAYALVRRSLGGAPDLFWAMERGHVVGTPFSKGKGINAAVAEMMVNFGASFVVIWAADAAPGAPDGS